MSKARTYVIANWKMNGDAALMRDFDATFEAARGESCDMFVCPPAILLGAWLAGRAGRAETGKTDAVFGLGGQDCHMSESGAHTGDTSAMHLKSLGAELVLVGHSERRSDHGETDQQVGAKLVAALSAGLKVVLCVGETRAQREAGQAEFKVLEQLETAIKIPENLATHVPNLQSALIVAYEPIWAIGTGLVASPNDVAQMHKMIRDHLIGRFGAEGEAISILYGGSVKPSNVESLFEIDHVNGALVGGASLDAKSFLAIKRAGDSIA